MNFSQLSTKQQSVNMWHLMQTIIERMKKFEKSHQPNKGENQKLGVSMVKEQEEKQMKDQVRYSYNVDIADNEESDNQRQIEEEELCQQHDLLLAYVFPKSNYKVCCIKCLHQKHHLNINAHKEALSIPEAYPVIRMSLIECQAKLKGKDKFLEMIGIEIKKLKARLDDQKQKYKAKLQKVFKQTINLASQNLNEYMKQQEKKLMNKTDFLGYQESWMYDDLTHVIKLLQKFYQTFQRSISQVLEAKSSNQKNLRLHACIFYAKHFQTFISILSEEETDFIKQNLFSVTLSTLRIDSINPKQEISNLQQLLNDLFDIKQDLNWLLLYPNIHKKIQEEEEKKRLAQNRKKIIERLQKQANAIMSRESSLSKISPEMKRRIQQQIKNYQC